MAASGGAESELVRTFDGIFLLVLMSVLMLTCVHHLDQPKALLPDPPSPDQDEDQSSEEESSGDEIKSKVR